MSELESYLQKISKDELIDESVFTALIECFMDKTEFNSSLCSPELKDAVWAVLVVAVCHDWSPDELGKNLASHVSHDFQEKMVNSYRMHGKHAGSMIRTVKWQNPDVADLEWSVSKALESRDLVRIGVPSTSVTLHTLHPGQTDPTTVKFDCDPHQLQDFHFKVKEALNTYNSLKK